MELAFARTKYYYDRLDGLQDFWGFFPRTYLPQARIYGPNDDDSEKVTLFFIDTHQEIKVGVGLNFPVCELFEGEM